MYSALQDESISQEGDLYIRSVCFSPDGRFLATGDEDKLIRVFLFYFSCMHQDIFLFLFPDLGYSS